LLALLALESLPQPQLSIMELVTCLWHMSNFSAGTGHVPSVTPTFSFLSTRIRKSTRGQSRLDEVEVHN
jgi:hypothetical protein